MDSEQKFPSIKKYYHYLWEFKYFFVLCCSLFIDFFLTKLKTVYGHFLCLVYLRSLPDIVYTRMQRRNRPEERTIKLDYLVDLHEYYEKWLMEKYFNLPCSLLVIDVNKDLSDNQLVDIYKTYENIILGKVPVI